MLWIRLDLLFYNDSLAVRQDGHYIDVGGYFEIIPKYPELNNIDSYEDSLIILYDRDCEDKFHYA